MSALTSGRKTPKIVFGAMTIGKPNTLSARIHTVEEAADLLDAFQQHGYDEVDTARGYGNGTTEEMLAALNWQGRNLVMGTKLYPTAVVYPDNPNSYSHRASDVRRGLSDSLKALDTEHVDIFYLHGPDRKTPFEETLREVNLLHEEGRFSRFGLSNFMSWEVAEMCQICDRNGWIKPTVYQGVYHVLQRVIEPELMPCLRRYNMSFYAYQPLAGGFLTGRYKRDELDVPPGSRFDAASAQGRSSRDRYWNDEYFDALDIINEAAQKHGLATTETSLRWLMHHSQLSGDVGDAIIVGASSRGHLEANLRDLEAGPLSDDVVSEIGRAWTRVRGVAPKYWH